MLLPDIYLIIDKTVTGDRSAEQILSACMQGIRLIRLRAHGLSDPQYRDWISQLLPLAQQQGARVLIDRYEYLNLGADGLHISSSALRQYHARPVSSALYFAASTHDLAELQHAQALGVDFVTLSPVKPTQSHPDHVALGWPRFAQWIREINCPVFALGGLAAADQVYAQQQGAWGIAGIRNMVKAEAI